MMPVEGRSGLIVGIQHQGTGGDFRTRGGSKLIGQQRTT
jgi:hypothetical protein